MFGKSFKNLKVMYKMFWGKKLILRLWEMCSFAVLYINVLLTGCCGQKYKMPTLYWSILYTITRSIFFSNIVPLTLFIVFRQRQCLSSIIFMFLGWKTIWIRGMQLVHHLTTVQCLNQLRVEQLEHWCKFKLPKKRHSGRKRD